MKQSLFTVEHIRALEQIIYHQEDLSEYQLMKRAGMAAFERMKQCWPSAKEIVVFIGKGNNGGDGIVLAGLAQLDGIKVHVFSVESTKACSATAKEALDEFGQYFGNVQRFTNEIEIKADLIVDALLGIGVQGEVQSPVKEAIQWINAQDKVPVLAVDMPSGLNADTGEARGEAVRATKTVTFLGQKPGLFTCDGRDHSGDVILETLQCPERASDLHLLKELSDPRAPRKHNSHKGDYGRVLVVGGQRAMGGAVILASEAALDLGAGWVKLVCDSAHHAAILARKPEIMTYEEQDLDELLTESDVVAVGPGLGTTDWAQTLFQKVLQCDKPMVVDASALTLLAQTEQQKKNWILTPHPGEAAQLLGISTREVQENRVQAARKIQKKYGGVVVLKGSGTIVTDGQETLIMPVGDPWMAQAGQGDRLTGIIISLLGQHVSLMQAACYGVYLHGTRSCS